MRKMFLSCPFYIVFVFSHPISWPDTLPNNIAECKAHAVALLPDEKAYWLPLLQSATVRSIEVALGGGGWALSVIQRGY